MIRLLAKVDKVRTLKTFREDGFERSDVYCYATIKSAARSTFKMPRGLKGKKIRVLRTYVHPWRIKAGDSIVLDPKESEAAIRKHVRLKGVPSESPGFGKKRLSSVRLSTDGLRKYVIENAFLRSFISPDYGARVSDLVNLGTGHNELYGGGGYGSAGYVLLGGVEESLSRVGKPPDLWNASYKRVKATSSDIAFEHKSEKKPGLGQTKSFSLLPDAPVLCQSSTFQFKPKQSRKKKGKKPKMELNYVPRIFFGIGGETSYTNLFLVPTDEELVRMRYNVPPWEFRWGAGIWDWRKKWHAIKPGFVLLANEETGECLAAFASPEQLNFAWLGKNLGTPRLYLSHRPKKLKPKEKVSYGIGLAVGVAYDVTKESLLLLAKGTSTEDGIPYAIIYRGMSKAGSLDARASIDGTNRSVHLVRKEMDHLGCIHCASFVLDREPRRIVVELAAGRDKLRAEVER
jgi:hypothetical protein